MTRYTKQTVSSIAGINSELTKIQTAIRDSLSRLGDSPNQMQDLLDMNSNRIINLPLPLSDLEPVRRVDIEGIVESATQAALEALAVALNPEKEGPVSVGSLVGGVFEFSTIEYTPGASEIWVFSNGSKLELGADYTESSSTSVTFTPSFLSSVSPDTRVEVWTVAITPNNAFDLIRDRGLSKYILLEDFNPLAGSGGDDTSSFLAACTASASTGKSVLLLNRTYLIEPQLFTTTVSYTVAGLLGVPGSRIEPYGDLKFPATDYCLLHINVQDSGLVQGFTVDAKVSQTTEPNVDPVLWNSSNYDTWYGSRGLVIRDSTGYHLDRVTSLNSYSAPVFTINSTAPRHTNNVSERSRGNFGDGYYNSSVRGLTEFNNVARDFTRIGFVSEAFDAAPYISARVVRMNCHAEDGHDSSNKYGAGVEFNAGFWDEHSGWVTNIGCTFKDVGDRGFVSSMVASTEQQEELNGATAIPFHYIDCSGDGANEFVTSSSQQSVFQHYWVMENCHGINIRWRFAQLSGHLRPKESYVLRNCSVRLSPQDTTPGAVIQAAVLCQGGEIEIDGLTVYYEGRNLTDYLSATNATKTISHSGTRASAKVTVNNLRVYDETGARIPGTVCFRSPEFGTILKVSNTWLQGIDNRCTETHYDNCTLDPLNTERSIFRMTNCVVKSIAGGVGDFRTISIFDGQTRCEIFDTLFDLRVWSNYLHLFNNSKITSNGLAKVHRCKFMWDAAVNGHVIQLNANTTLKGTTNNIYNFEISSCEFENTGAATANPILRGEFDPANGAKVYGVGNYKSSNLSVLTSGEIQSNWSVKNFGAA